MIILTYILTFWLIVMVVVVSMFGHQPSPAQPSSAQPSLCLQSPVSQASSSGHHSQITAASSCTEQLR